MNASRSVPIETEIHRRVAAARRGENPRVVARMASGWAVLGDAQFLRGYCLLLPDPPPPTLNDLVGEQRVRFLSDMARLGDAVVSVCRPLRVNYEILGNLEPALHAHVIPRYPDEPEALRTKAVWLYPADIWTDPAHAFDPERHAPLMAELRSRLEGP